MSEEKSTTIDRAGEEGACGMPSLPRDVRTGEHFEQCDECREWWSWLKVRRPDGSDFPFTSGGL
jgi:hypothetical protein